MQKRSRQKVGVLAIQGDVEAHAKALARLGAEARPVLRDKDLDDVDALILPGGESTTIAKGLERLGLYEPLQAFAAAGHPVLGTCAGAILLARKAVGHEAERHPVRTLGLLDLVAVRNAYGTQVDSFAAPADPDSDARFAGLRCVFIRAPQLQEPSPQVDGVGAQVDRAGAQAGGVEVLVRVEGRPVLVRQGSVLGCTFHPELGDDSRVHQLLLEARS